MTRQGKSQDPTGPLPSAGGCPVLKQPGAGGELSRGWASPRLLTSVLNSHAGPLDVLSSPLALLTRHMWLLSHDTSDPSELTAVPVES